MTGSNQPLPIVLSWSGGKDSALALHALRQRAEYKVVSLLTTVSKAYGRISHHGVRVALLEQQAAAVGVPLCKVYLPSNEHGSCTNQQYESVMREAILEYQAAGVNHVAFGDLFLEDLRNYRESRLAEVGMQAMFPLWLRDTTELAQEFIDLGFVAYLSCVDGRKLNGSFAGRRFARAMLADLPATVDPCGENGEFHSFVSDGPIFAHPVNVSVGERVKRDDRYFVDLLSATSGPGEETPQALAISEGES